MKKKNIVGIIIIVLFVIGIAAALMQYKREQTALEQPEVGEEPETVVLSAYQPFGSPLSIGLTRRVFPLTAFLLMFSFR